MRKYSRSVFLFFLVAVLLGQTDSTWKRSSRSDPFGKSGNVQASYELDGHFMSGFEPSGVTSDNVPTLTIYCTNGRFDQAIFAPGFTMVVAVDGSSSVFAFGQDKATMQVKLSKGSHVLTTYTDQPELFNQYQNLRLSKKSFLKLLFVEKSGPPAEGSAAGRALVAVDQWMGNSVRSREVVTDFALPTWVGDQDLLHECGIIKASQ